MTFLFLFRKIAKSSSKYHVRIVRRIKNTTCHAPIIKDIMEQCIDDTLDSAHFPYTGVPLKRTNVAKSVRFGNSDRKESEKFIKRTRLIIFVAGGMSFSEMRCAHEVTKAYENWEVIIGSTHIITPTTFLKDLEKISRSLL